MAPQWVKNVGVLAVGAVGGVLALKAGLVAVGFGAGGVIFGSMAAATQAAIGNVAAGSSFAFWQSLGAGGAGVCPWIIAAGLGALLLWGIYKAYQAGWFGRLWGWTKSAASGIMRLFRGGRCGSGHVKL